MQTRHTKEGTVAISVVVKTRTRVRGWLAVYRARTKPAGYNRLFSRGSRNQRIRIRIMRNTTQ